MCITAHNNDRLYEARVMHAIDGLKCMPVETVKDLLALHVSKKDFVSEEEKMEHSIVFFTFIISIRWLGVLL